MNTKVSWRVNLLMFVCSAIFAVLVCSTTVLGISYTITDLGVVTYSESHANAINDYGEITGYSGDWGSYEHPFIWANGTMTDIGTLGGGRCIGKDINNKREVTGYSHTTCLWSGWHAFLYTGGVMTDIGMGWKNGRSNSWGYSLNDSAQVVGYFDESTSAMNCGTPSITPEHPFLYDGIGIDLGTLDGSYDGWFDENYAYGINNSGQIVGLSTASNGDPHAFLYENGVMTDLGSVGSSGIALANSINNKGDIVGISADITNSVYHATLWLDSNAIDLGTIQDNQSEAKVINDVGQIIGDVTNIGSCLWQNGNIYIINDLLPANSNWTLGAATDLNIRGQIVGTGTNPSGQTRAYLLTPVPEPATVIQVQINSSLNDPNLRIGHYSLATDDFDIGMDIPIPQPRTNTIDLYIVSDFNSPLDRLGQELRDANSLTAFQCVISGEQLSSPASANISLEIMDPNNEDNFAEKEIYLDLCDPCDNPIASYNVKNLAERGNTIPITVNNGMSYKLYFRFYDPEDIDRSRRVDFTDFSKVAENYMLTDANAFNDYYSGADINRSGSTDLVEISLIAEKWLAETF